MSDCQKELNGPAEIDHNQCTRGKEFDPCQEGDVFMRILKSGGDITNQSLSIWHLTLLLWTLTTCEQAHLKLDFTGTGLSAHVVLALCFEWS